MACPSCGADLPDRAKFCPVCGARGYGACLNCGQLNPAAARFCCECGSKLRTDIERATSPLFPLPLHAERRQLTVMFCDLVGSTPLALTLDPEDLLQVIGSFQSTIAAIVERYGGYIARQFGDGLLVYFGWPQADETAAERAVRAGLAAVDAVARKSVKGETLRVRIGIASGVVVVGDIVEPDAAREKVIVGEAPNLAARLQALAQSNTVVISDAMRTQIGELFECEDLGVLTIQGYAEPVRAWRVHTESVFRSRFEALRRSPVPMIGRDEELNLLLDGWNQAKRGNGRVVLIAGEAGIGKSRLIEALEGRLTGESFTRLRYFCAPYHRDTALHPIIGQLEDMIDPGRKANPAERLRSLRALAAKTGLSREDVALIADMLSLASDKLPIPNLSPQRRKEKTFQVLNRQFNRLARERPIFMTFEDVHWSDPTTLELFNLAIETIQGLPVLFLMTFRPDFQAQWLGSPGVMQIVLKRLNEPQSAALVAQLGSPTPLHCAVIDRIVAGSDGVPLFVEELTKVALENASLHGPSRAAVLPLTLPTTLEGLLMARLDRFPIGKEVAHVGAVIGREFSHAMLAAVTQMPEAILLQGLAQLIDAGLVFRQGTPPQAVYMFKHALVQDAAYETILRSRRSMLHAKVVEVLLAQTPHLEKTQPGLLGHHCAQAGQFERAALYYRRAGERSAERAALAETRKQLERGLTLVGALPDDSARRILEVELKLALGRVLLSTKGNADVEAGNIFEEAIVLCRGLNRMGLLTRALWGWWFNQAHRHNLAVAETAAQELLQAAKEPRDARAQVVAHGMLGITRLWQGCFEEARSNLQATLDLFRTGYQKPLDLAIISNNLETHANMQLSLTLACLGHLEAGATLAKRATETGLELAHLPSRAIILAVKCRHDWFVRDDRSLRETASALIALSQEQAFPFYLSLGRCHFGWLAVKSGHIERGLSLLKAGLNELQSTDAIVWEPYLRGMMAEALIWAGNADEARGLIDRALDLSAQTGGVWFDAELHRCKGESLVKGAAPDHQSAEECFHRAIAIARGQSARLWELRASTSLAELWFGQGRKVEAHAMLASVYSWFAEASEAFDVRHAAAQLAKMAG